MFMDVAGGNEWRNVDPRNIMRLIALGSGSNYRIQATMINNSTFDIGENHATLGDAETAMRAFVEQYGITPSIDA